MERRASIGVTKKGINSLPKGKEIGDIKTRLLSFGNTKVPTSSFTTYQWQSKESNSFNCKCKVDERVEEFCKKFLGDHNYSGPYLPLNDFICDKCGIARILSLPENSDEFHSDYVDSYRTYNGVLHNPSTDKRTTKDVFHIVEGGPSVPSDKKEVPKVTFAKMLQIAFNPNGKMLIVPLTVDHGNPVKLFVSNYMKPIICPKMEGIQEEKKMEIRFFVPGSLVSILDCTESIFGNAGSPFLPENDAALDPVTWTGHTGCVVFAPQLRKCTKKFLGLPHVSEASERQKKDGMCWENEDELYHDGKPFRIMARDGNNVVVSIVADSYNGYGKKEIKSQMSYVANMLGMCEEEHSGGTLVFPRYDLGDKFNYSKDFGDDHRFENTITCCSKSLKLQGGFAIDKRFPNIVYLPEYANFYLPELAISWVAGGKTIKLPLEFEKVYILPSGYRIALEKPDGKNGRWKMIGTSARGIFCYKPATVSGGGKSEIAKPIDEFISTGPTIIFNYDEDCKLAQEIILKDFSKRFRDNSKIDSRSLLDSNRSLGSVIKLLTPNDYYTDEYNFWLKSIPRYILELIFTIKRFSKNFSELDWQQFFTVDKINGEYGNELRYNGEKLFEHYLRIGFDFSNHWRLFSLRDDFVPSMKFQLADDISVTTTVPAKNIPYLQSDHANSSVKIVHNCEYRLYQRPDEAIVPGYDPGSEYDMTLKNIFTCNFKALTRDDVKQMMHNRIKFETYSIPMKKMLENFVHDENAPNFIVCPSELRIMSNGTISKNQRYLQNRNDICHAFDIYLTTVSSKLWRKYNYDFDVRSTPVSDILSGRRNNLPEVGVSPLCVYGPLHYMDLPELFLEYMSSVTGKSPSTTGAGLEGAMTKGPFNCLSSIYDLNNALLSFILTGYSGFLSAAGYVGPHFKVDHDITYLLPEIWCRMTKEERDPKFLIEHEYLERCENFRHNGKLVQAERLGYRITRKFIKVFAGRVFQFPDVIFSDRMLRPETQDMDIFADSMDTIVEAHRRAALLVVDNFEFNNAIPPLRALLHIAVDGQYEGMTLRDKIFRAMFSRENIISSEWYMDRLKKYQMSQIEHLSKGLEYVKNFSKFQKNNIAQSHINLAKREQSIAKRLNFVKTSSYVQGLVGTIGK
ncbi:MAG: hypothetical protein LBB16_00860 [Puniceicoccales bacterium]|jgi:hypothetical protein|nr:hypothetical protein [Puniceicoccales bacterium]